MRNDIEETRLHQQLQHQARSITEQAPALLSMLEGKIYQIDHPIRYRLKKLWAAIRRRK